MESNIYAIVLIIWAMISAAQSAPSCTTLGEKDVVCHAGPQDYDLRRHLVSDNNKTTNIILSDRKITKIELESFENLFALQYLDLSKNKIQELKLGVLDGVSQLTFLNLSHNLLSGFHLGLFDQNPNLEVLDLNGNQITEIELGIFDPLKKLRHLDLSSNLLKGKYFNPFVFDESTSINILDFSKNDMSESPDNILNAFNELDHLKLDNCRLNYVPKWLKIPNISTLSHLILSMNLVKSIDDTDFENLVNLQTLDLSGNMIKSVTESAFKFSKKLKIVQLRFNRLINIPETLFQSIPVLNTVDLSHNKIQYLPVNAFRGTKIRNLNVADNRFSYLQDNFCLELRNSGVMLSKFYFNQNPWQCACLKELINEVKQYGITYNDSKYNGKVPVCVTTNDFVCLRQLELNNVFNEMYFANATEI